MAAINVLAGWAILSLFSPNPSLSPIPLPPPLGTWMDLPPPSPHPPLLPRQLPLSARLWKRRGRDGGGIYRGVAGPHEGGRSIGPVAQCRGNQPLITPAVVFTLLPASACLHSFAPEFALSTPRLPTTTNTIAPPLQPLPPAPSLCSRRCSTTTLSPPPPSPSTPLLITLTLFLSGKVRWSRFAAAAFHGHPRRRQLASVNTAVVQVFASICP